jgi:hypothetical protein
MTKLYGVLHKETLITHKICMEPKLVFFPALFEDYNEAVDYARGVGDVRVVNIRVNKKVLFKGDYNE